MQKHWKLTILLFVLFVMIFVVTGTIHSRNMMSGSSGGEDSTTPLESKNPSDISSDSIIMRKQPEMVKKYGNLPDGYLWDLNGSLLSQGDKSMTAEEVVYAYMNGIKTLDFSSAQKYSRNSKVVQTYGSFYDSKVPNVGYDDSFFRNIYKQALLSMQVKGIESNSVFAENKQVFTVVVEMLDLTDKDFWIKDKYEIYKSMMIYGMEDSTKVDLYLYDYILNYYKSGEASTREVTFDLTLEKFIDLDTGWLVSIDSDVDNACKYNDGVPVVRYIKEMYQREGREYVDTYEAPETTVAKKDGE